ncbi:MAG: NADP-dependent malic enzyme [Bacteroidota bacterium]
MKIRKEDALLYHSMGRKGKIEVITTKPCVTQRDLSLAYSPGVAEPCREIHSDESLVYEYTAKGNLVAVISNGTAVLGLGDIGPLAGKPVMEGKGVLFKSFADIDVFDIELASKDVDEIIRVIEVIAPTFGGINLEDIKGPECFVIEEELKKRLDIPVFHDDQHGTAIISGAALLNALEIVGKKIDEVKVVFNGAGASGIACAKFYISLGVKKENIIMCDSQGVIYKGRTKGMNTYKEEFAIETDARTLADALVGADVFAGLSQGNVVTKDMVRTMADNPIIFAMANPDPEISYEDAVEARPDVIMATGRSDYPNQVNNVLGFPFIFRGALDVHSKAINEEMKLAAAYALAALAKEEVPESVKRAYGVKEMKFGREYIIPKPFDPRVLTWVAPAVAKAAMDTGVARRKIEDFEEYKRQLNIRMGRAQVIMTPIFKRASQNPKSVVLPEGDNPKIMRAALNAIDAKIAKPILLGNPKVIEEVAKEHGIDISEMQIIDPMNFNNLNKYIDEFLALRQRKGIIRQEAYDRLRFRRNYFGAMMVHLGDADAMVTGVSTHYPDAVRPALEIIGKDPKYNHACGCYIVSSKNKAYFLADTTLNIEPTPEAIADIALATADFTANFDITPNIALLTYSNFGSAYGASPEKMRKALEIIRHKAPELIVDGEMQADTAVSTEIINETFPFSVLKTGANVLIFPNLDAGNIAYKLLGKIGGMRLIGPALLGMERSVHILQRGSDVDDIFNIIAIAVADAIHKE